MKQMLENIILHKQIKFYTLIFLSFVIFNHNLLSQESVSFYSNNGEKLSVVLPEGYCNINNTETGKNILSYLNNTLKNLKQFNHGEAMIAYNKCNQSFGYPWGYILLNHKKLDPSLTQLYINKFESKSFNRNFQNKIKDQINKN